MKRQGCKKKPIPKIAVFLAIFAPIIVSLTIFSYQEEEVPDTKECELNMMYCSVQQTR